MGLASPGALLRASGTTERADEVRLRRLVHEYGDFVWRNLRRLGVAEHLAEDAAQQVFLVLSRKLETVGEDHERSFLFGIVVRVSSEVRRAQSRRREVPDVDVEEPIDEAPSAEAMLDEKHARTLLDSILQSMPDDPRAVFVLCELEELTTAEVAEILAIPTGTVASRLRRAREHFHASVSRMKRAMRQP